MEFVQPRQQTAPNGLNHVRNVPIDRQALMPPTPTQRGLDMWHVHVGQHLPSRLIALGSAFDQFLKRSVGISHRGTLQEKHATFPKAE